MAPGRVVSFTLEFVGSGSGRGSRLAHQRYIGGGLARVASLSQLAGEDVALWKNTFAQAEATKTSTAAMLTAFKQALDKTHAEHDWAAVDCAKSFKASVGELEKDVRSPAGFVGLVKKAHLALKGLASRRSLALQGTIVVRFRTLGNALLRALWFRCHSAFILYRLFAG